ncbi:hypothetical protein [Arhodomonas sp. AD133]|uniref:hypothetical protein n=1 Tax=Arhodomonas sp. AD133 TaxID=3415009 RepID=UPI003EB8EF25
MSEEQEYAPQYSTRERVVRVIGMVIVAAIVVFPSEWWFFPWLERFSATSPCYEILGVRGHVVLMYGIFVGMPLGIALIAGSFIFRYAYRILRDGQVPPIGQKVMGRTPIRRGRSARVRAY